MKPTKHQLDMVSTPVWAMLTTPACKLPSSGGANLPWTPSHCWVNPERDDKPSQQFCHKTGRHHYRQAFPKWIGGQKIWNLGKPLEEGAKKIVTSMVGQLNYFKIVLPKELKAWIKKFNILPPHWKYLLLLTLLMIWNGGERFWNRSWFTMTFEWHLEQKQISKLKK